MNAFKNIIATILFFGAFLSVRAQHPDLPALSADRQAAKAGSAGHKLPGDTLLKINNGSRPVIRKHFPLKSLVIPGAMLAYGFTSLGNDGLKNLNQELKEDIWTERPHKLIHIDNYLMLTPALTVYGLNAMGIKGKNNFKDRTMILLLSNVILNTTVFTVKKLSHQMRPDGSNYYSFPSGHTAVAFASAEFLYQEYKNVSAWYGVAGYAMAAATGYLRMYNNKHWFSDVVAGAGLGIASVKITYWLYPKIKTWLFRNKLTRTAILPGYQNNSFVITLVHRLNE